jgi:hypothetical protein
MAIMTGAAAHAVADTVQKPDIGARFLGLPLRFEPDSRQAAEPGRFVARGSRYGFFVEPNRATLALQSRPKTSRFEIAATRSETLAPAPPAAVLSIEIAGGNPRAGMVPSGELPGKSNYFFGDDPSKWRTGVATHSRLTVQEVYPGIDLAYYGNQRNIEYDFIVAPGADPSRIAMRLGGDGGISRTGTGGLLVRVGDGDVLFHKPFAYQDAPTGRREVAANYRLSDDAAIRFELGPYDRGLPLVIDPVLGYSSYVGGSGTDLVHNMTIDSSGNIYITGSTTGSFPTTTGAYDTSYNTGGDAFVAKINPANSGSSQLVYSTYLGSSGNDEGNGIAVDTSGNAYIAGTTGGSGFPVTGTAGPRGGDDAFVTKLNASGSSLVYSVRMGGSFNDSGFAIAIDPSNNAYVAGYTTSPDYPISSAKQAFYGGVGDGFVTKLNSSASQLSYSTFLGGNNSDQALGIAVDGSGRAYVTGSTSSSNFPLKNAWQSIRGNGVSDAFVTKYNSSGSDYTYSTFLGGGSITVGIAIAADALGSAYVGGYTSFVSFATANAKQSSYQGGAYDGFVSKFSASGDSLYFSTYLGGSDEDEVFGLAVDADRNIYVAGRTYSTNFPTQNALQGSLNGPCDAFVTKYSSGYQYVYSTYLGGGTSGGGAAGTDVAYAVAADAAGNAFVAGETASGSFPTTGPAYQGSYGGGNNDGFVARLEPTAKALKKNGFLASTDWVATGFNTPGFAGTDFDAANTALRARVYSDPARFRVAGWTANSPEWLPYSAVGTNRYVRAKFYVYTGGQTNPSSNNEVPTLRARVANRFAVTSMLEVFSHVNVDSGFQSVYQELRPSADPAKPSLYRVDFDPVDVPHLVSNAATEGITRAFETYAIDPQDNGFLALAETSIGTYPRDKASDSPTPIKTYLPDDLKVFDAPTQLVLKTLIPGGGQGDYLLEDTATTTPKPTYSEGSFGITLDAALVAPDRIGIATRDFRPAPTNSTTIRVQESVQYKLKWHLTSTQQSNLNSQIRLRARSIRFGWSQKLEIGGAWAASVANDTIAQQALPGVGCQNPEKIGSENGGWYTMIMHTPMSIDIRPDLAGPLMSRMPYITAQPGFGSSAPSARDLRIGCDLVDTLSNGANGPLEQGNFTLDRVEIRAHDIVDD